MMSYTISRRRPRRLHTTSGFVSDDVALFRRLTSVYQQANHISSTLRQLFCYGKTTVHHIGILLPVSTSTISPQLAYHSAPVYETLSKSDRARQKNDAMSIFNGFFEKPMYDFLYVINRDQLFFLLFLRKSRIGIWRQTDKQMNRPIALSRSRYRERRLNKRRRSRYRTAGANY